MGPTTGSEEGKIRYRGDAPTQPIHTPNVHAFFALCTEPGSQPTLDGMGWKKTVHEQARKAVENF